MVLYQFARHWIWMNRRRELLDETASLNNLILNEMRSFSRLFESAASARPTQGSFLTSALNLHQADAEFLRTQLLVASRLTDVMVGEADEYGQRYVIDFECVNGNRRAVLRSARIVLKGDDFPRLATCYVLSESAFEWLN